MGESPAFDIDRDPDGWSRAAGQAARAIVRQCGLLPGMDREESEAECLWLAVRLARSGRHDPEISQFPTLLATVYRNHRCDLLRAADAEKRVPPPRVGLDAVSADDLFDSLTRDIEETEFAAARVADLLQQLPAIERRVVRLYYGIRCRGPLTQEQIARRLGLGRQRVGEILNDALNRLYELRFSEVECPN
jgi:RNA polymerase sigma factor (sigma-70 family)